MAKNAPKRLKSPINVIREVKVITDEYASVCAQAGEAQFQMKALEGRLNFHNQRLAELHKEHKTASDALAKKTASAETVAST